MKTAPHDRPLLLRLPKELGLYGDPRNSPVSRLRVVIGWFDEWSDTEWECMALEEGCGDSEGYSDCFPIEIEPDGWSELPES